MPDDWVPLSVSSHPVVVRLWSRGIDYESAVIVKRLLARGLLRRLPIGWWLKYAGWCPTFNVLEHSLRKRGYIAYGPSHCRPAVASAASSSGAADPVVPGPVVESHGRQRSS